MKLSHSGRISIEHKINLLKTLERGDEWPSNLKQIVIKVSRYNVPLIFLSAKKDEINYTKNYPLRITSRFDYTMSVHQLLF